MTEIKTQKKKCPNCHDDDCRCGLQRLISLELHTAGELCCVRTEEGLFTFVLIIDDRGVTEIHNYLKDNLATSIIFNCNTFGMRDAFEAQAELARKHASMILKPVAEDVE